MNTNWYFFDDEYDVFKYDRQSLNGKDERELRKRIQAKLLELNTRLIVRLSMNKMDLHNHPNKKNITSLIIPCDYNKGRVNWIGVRYGKSEKFLKLLNYGLAQNDSEDKLGFQKYACMQVDVGYSGVDVGIYHAVPHQALDRAYLHQNIDKLQKRLVKEISCLKFKGYAWKIWNTEKQEEYVFDFDNRPAEEFIEWYKQYDEDGTYSSMLKHFPRYDMNISAENIEGTCFDVISDLYKFYRVISWFPVTM